MNVIFRNNFCIHNGISKRINCQDLDFQELKNNNCDNLRMCNGTSTSFQYIQNALSICQQCNSTPSKANSHSTSSILEQSIKCPISRSSSDLFASTSSLAIIPTTSGELLLDQKT